VNEAQLSATAGPVAVLLDDHRRLEALLGEIATAERPAELERLTIAYMEALWMHIDVENPVFFPERASAGSAGPGWNEWEWEESASTWPRAERPAHPVAFVATAEPAVTIQRATLRHSRPTRHGSRRRPRRRCFAANDGTAGSRIDIYTWM
jgi:hypothetical protein